MARTVRKVKRRGKEITVKQLPAIIITPPELDMKLKVTNNKDNNTQTIDAVNEASTSTMDFNVNDLIAQLSENSKASKGEIENIQRKLLQQANEILKVNAFVNQPPEPRVVSATQKYVPIYGRPISVGNGPTQTVQVNQDAQLVPEKLEENVSEVNKEKRRVNTYGAGRGGFFYETSSARSAGCGSAHAASNKGECLRRYCFKNFLFFVFRFYFFVTVFLCSVLLIQV
ncbi:unnamed protein product [Euphydryas editha]|uniref:Uncharacterized protein n=1 Tax=Euphydryas editha TaxID=104508 RepID=A0AAU9TTU5_EUPED|nr:unnamed protein product [Euphydryas editha]